MTTVTTKTEIKLSINPALIILLIFTFPLPKTTALGGVAIGSINAQLAAIVVGITKIRGKWVDLNLNSISVPTLPTFHPAFLLRQPAQKKHVWEDLKSLKNKVSN